MAIRSSNKINPSFSMSSMTDLVFLLLIFFMITSTLVSPNALKLLLPQSNNQTSAKAVTSVSISKDLHYYIETTPVPLADLERQLQLKLMDAPDPTISLHMDETVQVKDMVKVMNIAARNKYKLIMATSPERRR
ncbi:MAG: biopolymer transporter ExbD [Bacteroidales bacterium]|jgi:biopolymer transport protein ExbD|nr:biopolymer transporter ExbD [Bacteroidales bacterium]